MYKLGRRAHGKGKIILASLAIVALLLSGAAVIFSRQFFKSDTTLDQSEGVIRHVDVIQPKLRTVSNSVFSLKLPDTWKESTNSMFTPPADYGWRGSGDNSARRLDIYMDDSIPADKPVNRLLPVDANGNRLVFSEGNLSDNCVNFTEANEQSRATGQTLAKWAGVAFYCDTGNYLRNIVGTGSQDTINAVSLKGESGRHRFFFIYTDHSGNPSYNVFYDILRSFRIK